jgi:hypothetical protein
MRTPEEMIAKTAKETPSNQRDLYLRCVAGKTSAKQRIKSFCQQCMGGFINEVKACTTAWCPLFKDRPYQRKVQNINQTMAKRKFPTWLHKKPMNGAIGPTIVEDRPK